MRKENKASKTKQTEKKNGRNEGFTTHGVSESTFLLKVVTNMK